MNESKFEAIKRMWKAQDDNHELSAFWQDHFYASNNRLGYPVCVQLLNLVTDQVEDFVIVGYYHYPDTCEAVLEEVQEYLFELDVKKLGQS